MANLNQSAQKPDWFDTRFNRPNEYATLQIPELHATVFEEATVDLFSSTMLWGTMMELRAILEDQVAEPERWVHVSGWHLAHHLKLMSDINFGVDRFLPARHQRMPLHDRRALYLCYFLIKGLVMLDKNPAEDFGFPELAARLGPAERPALAASQVLWHLVALPHITDEIMRRQKQSAGRGAGVDGALLAMLGEMGESADDQWRGLFNVPPDAIMARLVKRFHREDRDTGLTSSQVYDTARRLQSDRGAGELLARALEMEAEHYSTAVRNDLRTAHRKAEKDSDDEREAVDTFRLAIRIRDLPYDTPAERGAAAQAALRQMIEDPKTDTTLRRLATFILQNPEQSNTVLARRLGVKSPKTVRDLKTKLRKMLPS